MQFRVMYYYYGSSICRYLFFPRSVLSLTVENFDKLIQLSEQWSKWDCAVTLAGLTEN